MMSSGISDVDTGVMIGAVRCMALKALGMMHGGVAATGRGYVVGGIDVLEQGSLVSGRG